jgi:hypothetical protein
MVKRYFWSQNVKMAKYYHRVETYRAVTDRRSKHCGSLRFHAYPLFSDDRAKNDQLRVLSKFREQLKWVVIRSSSNQMHASSNLPSICAQKSGYTSYNSVYVSTRWYYTRPNNACSQVRCWYGVNNWCNPGCNLIADWLKLAQLYKHVAEWLCVNIQYGHVWDSIYICFADTKIDH